MTVKLREDIEALKEAVGIGDTTLADRVEALETAVGDADSGLVEDVAALKNLISDDGETKMLFGMVVTIDNSTGAVSLTAPASEG